MDHEIIELSKKLISIKSTKENPIGLDRTLELSKKYLSGFKIESFECRGSKSILVHNCRKRPDKFKIILNAHLDVVSADKGQFIPKLKGHCLYGRGSLDMKCAAAAEMVIFKQMAKILNSW